MQPPHEKAPPPKRTRQRIGVGRLRHPEAGFVKLMRTPDVQELIKYPYAFTLLALIALRARRRDCRITGLRAGEAMLGDYKSVGLTEQKYRTALKRLRKSGIILTKATNKGTIARIMDVSIWDINSEDRYEYPVTGDQSSECVTTGLTDELETLGEAGSGLAEDDAEFVTERITDKQRADNGPITTNKKDKNKRKRESSPQAALGDDDDFSFIDKVEYEIMTQGYDHDAARAWWRASKGGKLAKNGGLLKNWKMALRVYCENWEPREPDTTTLNQAAKILGFRERTEEFAQLAGFYHEMNQRAKLTDGIWIAHGEPVFDRVALFKGWAKDNELGLRYFEQFV